MNNKSKDNVVKHQVLINSVLVIALVITMIGGSYAWFNSQDTSSEYNAFKEENFEVSYVAGDDGYGDILSLVNQNPISDSEGVKLEPYRFSITNLGDKEKNFRLKISLDQSIIDADDCINDILSTSYVKYKIDNQKPQILGLLEDKDYEIYVSNETIMPGSSEIHELRIWIDENSPSIVKNKHFHATVNVETYDKSTTYDSYKLGQEVTLLDGTKYYVLKDSDETNSKVKLISAYNINSEGKQDTKCIITDFIKNKVSKEEQSLYCSTMILKDAKNVLYDKYLNNLQTNLAKYKTRIDNIEIRLPEKDELELALGINENIDSEKINIINSNWLGNLNFWTMTNNDNDLNYNYTLSVDSTKLAIKQYSKDSKYFGLRPVIIIEKDNLKK